MSEEQTSKQSPGEPALVGEPAAVAAAATTETAGATEGQPKLSKNQLKKLAKNKVRMLYCEKKISK